MADGSGVITALLVNCSGSGNGNGFMTMPSTALKTIVFAPIPRASVAATTTEKTGFFLIDLRPYRTS